ncbi:MAG: hypothetical protein JWQ20_92 [Conexibacter sp.]|nr:hypothetical protein [Conexibacter sp.]
MTSARTGCRAPEGRGRLGSCGRAAASRDDSTAIVAVQSSLDGSGKDACRFGLQYGARDGTDLPAPERGADEPLAQAAALGRRSSAVMGVAVAVVAPEPK